MDRSAFTLIELLVAVAVVSLILVVLAQAFQAGVETISRFKAIGNMSDHLRAAMQQIRGDLAADHFEGGVRLSDPQFSTRAAPPPGAPAEWPREGFFCVRQFGPSWVEGMSDGIRFYRAPGLPGRTHALHFTVKLRGNRDKDFFGAGCTPQVRKQGTFFDPAAALQSVPLGQGMYEDARYQYSAANDPQPIYRSQWAEIAYFLMPVRNDAGQQLLAGGTTPLYSLHRTVLVLVTDNSWLNGQAASQAFSWVQWSAPMPPASQPQSSFWNTPSSIRYPRNRVFRFATALGEADAGPLPLYGRGIEQLLLSDVVSFSVQVLPAPPVKSSPSEYGPTVRPQPFGYPMRAANASSDFTDVPVYDSATSPGGLLAIQVTLRVWDARTSQTRQISIIQDL